MKFNSTALQAISLTWALISSNVQAIESTSQMTLEKQKEILAKTCSILDQNEIDSLPWNTCEVSSDGWKTWIPYAGGIAGIIALMLSWVLLVRVYRKKEWASTQEVPQIFTTQNRWAPKTRSAVLPSKGSTVSEDTTPVQVIDEEVPQIQIEHTVWDTIEWETGNEGSNSLTPEIQIFVKPEDEGRFNDFMSDSGADNNPSWVDKKWEWEPLSDGIIITTIGDSNDTKVTEPSLDEERIKRLADNRLDEESRIKRSSWDIMDIYVTTHLKKRWITFTNDVNAGVIKLKVNKEWSGIYFQHNNVLETLRWWEEFRILWAKKLNFRQLDKKPCIEIVYPDYTTNTIELMEI
jgi:hypothetical protein